MSDEPFPEANAGASPADAPVGNPVPQPPPPVPHNTHWIFFGPNGLRAGWGALIFLCILALLALLVGVAAHFILHRHRPVAMGPQLQSPLPSLIGEALQAAVILLATWIMSRIEGRRILDYGYAGRARLARFLWGCVWGFVALSALVGALWGTHLLAFDAGHLRGAAAAEYGLAWLGMFFLTGVSEESLMRGYLQSTLTRGIGFWWGALLMSLVFGLLHGHNAGESPVGLFSAGAVGFVFCISLRLTGSLWWAIGFHTAWDWAQSYFYGTSDSGFLARGHLLNEHPVGALLWSGGPTGPEGSLYIIPLLIIMTLAMWLWWRRAGAAAA